MYIYICSSCEQGQQRQQPESPTSRTQPQAKAKPASYASSTDLCNTKHGQLKPWTNDAFMWIYWFNMV